MSSFVFSFFFCLQTLEHSKTAKLNKKKGKVYISVLVLCLWTRSTQCLDTKYSFLWTTAKKTRFIVLFHIQGVRVCTQM